MDALLDGEEDVASGHVAGEALKRLPPPGVGVPEDAVEGAPEGGSGDASVAAASLVAASSVGVPRVEDFALSSARRSVACARQRRERGARRSVVALTAHALHRGAAAGEHRTTRPA